MLEFVFVLLLFYLVLIIVGVFLTHRLYLPLGLLCRPCPTQLGIEMPFCFFFCCFALFLALSFLLLCFGWTYGVVLSLVHHVGK